ncbi:MAG: VOC family protein [Ruminococcaceae bacterium]|nr:VOC family protein [Oscillospiraceae bacterium]
MKFHHISLRVKNFENSLKFYTELAGLKVAGQFSAGGGNVAYLCDSEGDTEVELIAMPEGQTFEGKGMFLCFATDNLEIVREKAVSLGMNPSDIRQPEPDAKYFYVYDPDGVSVQFREYK